ncbi:MAG: hypothetical protein LBK25_03345 [Treponema sp.]|nr:hypothetical protein [Treponema sp.]
MRCDKYTITTRCCQAYNENYYRRARIFITFVTAGTPPSHSHWCQTSIARRGTPPSYRACLRL